MVWGRPLDAKRTDAAAPPAAKAQAPSSMTPAPDASWTPAPETSWSQPVPPVVEPPRASVAPQAAVVPEPVAPAPSSVDLPVASGPVVEPVAPRGRARVAAPAVASAPAVEPVSRRARRTQTGEQPVAAVPPIAPVAPAEPVAPAVAFEADLPARQDAPLLDTVLAPAEPFELLEPVVVSETPASTTAAPEPAEPAAGAASTWMAETFARLLAAETATVASTAPLVETGAAQPTAAPQPVEQAPAAAHTTAVAPSAASAPQAPAAAAEPDAARIAPAQETAQARTGAAPDVAPPARPAEPRVSQANAERPRAERAVPSTGPMPEPTASDVDEFELAARLFAFTGETPVQSSAPVSDDTAAPAADAETARHSAPRRSPARRGAAFKRVATASFSVGVFGIVGLMAVGMTTPAEAVAAVNGTDASLSVVAAGDSTVPVIDEAEIQAYVAPGDAQNDTLQRTENYTTTTTAQLASEAGIKNFSNLFHNDPNSNIQWPFAVGVTMSYGFGMRSGRMHEGIDFTPGAGAPIQAIADGTVRVASEAGGAYGVHVIIDHIVDGQLISSHYAHMQYGSLQVSAGQHVTVGTMLGRTGNTGRSYGAHTHFELLKNGTTAIDPMPWLRTYTDGTHTVG